MDTVTDIELMIMLEIDKHSSYREIADSIHKSLRTVQMHLTSLEWRGMIEKPHERKSRSLIITNEGRKVLQNAFPKRTTIY